MRRTQGRPVASSPAAQPRKLRGTLAALLLAVPLFGGAWAATSDPPDPGTAAEGVFVYDHAGSTVTLRPSRVFAATLALTEAERGIPATPPDGLVIDARSSRSDLAERGLTLFRVPAALPARGLEPPPPVDAWEAVLTSHLAAQPVFEQGAALKIATDEVIVAFRDAPSPERARLALGEAYDRLRVKSLTALRPGAFLVALRDAGGGRAFDAARALARVDGVLHAEPSFFDVFLETPPAAPALPRAPRDLVFLSRPHQIEAPVGGRSPPSWERPHVDGDWTVVLDGHFETDAGGWLVAFEGVRVEPLVTQARAHSGRRAVYMTGSELAGRRPPGPYADGASTYLVSPAFDLDGYVDAFVEIWFWARFENPPPGRPFPPDFGRLLLLERRSGRFVMNVPLAPIGASGDLAHDPTGDGGWRRLLVRVPRSLRLQGLVLAIQFLSDGAGAAEGLYVDDVRVLATQDRDRRPITNDPLLPDQVALVPAAQIAGRPSGEDLAIRGADAWHHGPAAKDVIVALLDDGVERDHPDLAYWADEADDDTAAIPFPSEPLDPADRHGTACAGVLGAIARNGTGIAGAAPGARLLPLRRGADDASIVLAIDEAVRRRARVLVIPWGWTGAPSRTIARAIEEAIERGTIVVAAAGDVPASAPYGDRIDFPCVLGASTPLVCVGAASPAGEPKDAASADGQYWWRSATSRKGPDLIAPGTWLHATDRRGPLGYNDGAEDVPADWTSAFGGTGAAACYLGGVAALMASRDPRLTPAEAKSILQRTAATMRPPTRTAAAARLVVPGAAVRAAAVLAESRDAAPAQPGERDPADAVDEDPERDAKDAPPSGPPPSPADPRAGVASEPAGR